ncbi:MAG: fibronectin type III domain-containing protein [Flavisolibacter sp.]|nr:fibronectin type III domain-containing protein [Flavisolibacter sp.]
MRRIKLGFLRYADAKLLAIVEACITALTGNIFYPVITPSLATVQTLFTEYSTSLATAAEGGKTNVAAKNAKKKELAALMTSLALCLMQLADGDELKLVSTGLPLTKTPSPVPPIGVPLIAKIEGGLSAGELDVTIKRLPGAILYVYQYTLDPLTENSEWISQNSTYVKLTLTGLENGKRYWIRVVAYGSNEQMTISDPQLSRVVQ